MAQLNARKRKLYRADDIVLSVKQWLISDAYVIILLKSVGNKPSKTADIFAPYVLIPNDPIRLIEFNAVAISAKTRASWAQKL